MTIKDKFKREVHIDSKVELNVFGIEILGTILAIDTATVTIEQPDGKEQTISLDHIASYSVENDKTQKSPIKNLQSSQLENNKTPIQCANEKNDNKRNENIINKNSNKEKDEVSVGKEAYVFSTLKERGETYFDIIESPLVKSVLDTAKKANGIEIKPELQKISNSIDYAITQAHEISPADYKIQENIGKLRRLIQNNPKIKDLSNMLGAIYYCCKCDGLALDAYIDGNDNISGFAIAEKMHDYNNMDFFALRHFIFDNETSPYIIKYLLCQMFKQNDYSLIQDIKLQHASASKIQCIHAVIRAILLYNDKKYDNILDFDITLNGINKLLKIFHNSNLSKNSSFSEKIPKDDLVPVKSTNQQDNRTLEECPIFAEAELVRIKEKDIKKAAKLYKKAIENNEKTGSAVANLFQILVSQGEYDECARYLGIFGSQYMREEAYKNLKKQFLSTVPKKATRKYASMLAKYEKEENTPIDYFSIAQKAEVEEKNLQKAITNYKEAIKNQQRMSASVANLASIYSRLEMYDDAFVLLDKYGNTGINRLTLLNLKKTILDKAKNPKYKEILYDTFSELIEIQDTKEKKNEQQFHEAYLLMKMELFDDALKILLKCEKNLKENEYLDKDKYRKHKTNILTSICNTYYKIGDNTNSHIYAEKVLSFDPENQVVKSILSGNVDEEIDFTEQSRETSQINDFIQTKINELSLDLEIKNKEIVNDGVFLASSKEAKKILSSIFHKAGYGANDEAKSNSFFAAAKIIRQLLDENEEIVNDEDINEQKYLYFIAEGSCSYGNSRLYRTELTDNFDTARYCYTQTMSIFNDSTKIQKPWSVATIRYIQTYFSSIEEIKKEGLYGKYTTNNDVILEIQKIMRNVVKTDIYNFVIGMIELLTYNTRIKDDVLRYIYSNVYQGKIMDVLADISDEDISDTITEGEFSQLWDAATKNYFSKRKAYLHLINTTINGLFIIGQLSNNIEKIINDGFDRLLCKTDKEYMHNLQNILNSIVKYNEIPEFDYKAETLNRVEDERIRLEEKIQDYPTAFSYEKLLPELQQMQAKIFRESSLLYGDSEPEITVELSGDCSIEEEAKIVRVPIAFVNKQNTQNADNVRITIGGNGIINVNDTQLSKIVLVGNGRAREELFIFKYSDEIISSQEVSIEIKINYQYKKNMTEIEEKIQEFVLSVPLFNDAEFEPIENKFEPHKNGSEVKDASMFYGRDNDINSIISNICDKNGNVSQGRCLALYGQTRTGKSSLLYHLERRLRSINPEGIIIVNIGSIGEENLEGDNISDFLYTILDSLKTEINRNHKDLKPILEDYEISINPDKLHEEPEHAQLYFNNTFKHLNNCLSDQEKKYSIVIMIDEFTYIYDWIRQGTMTDKIMKFWKAFIQNNGVFAIIIGQDHMMKFVNEKQFTNDFGSTDLRKITYLAEEDAKRLMYEPIMIKNKNGEMESRYREGALDRLYELTSGSAFLIMNLCAGLVDYLNEVHSAYITRAHIDDYLRRNLESFQESRFFEPQYDDKSELNATDVVERNKNLLRRIAQRSNKKEWTPLKSVILQDEDKETLKNLEMRDVVIVSNNERCKIKVALYKEWILEKYGLEANYE